MPSRILPPPGVPRTLALAQLANSLGDGAYFVCSVLYFTRVVGLTPTQAGLGLTLGWGLGFLAGVPFGHLADRLGPRGTSIGLALSTAAALTSFIFVESFGWFIVAACAYACLQTGFAISRQTLLACAVFALTALGSSAWLAVGLLLAGAIVQVYAEMMLASGTWEVSLALAPEGKTGQYQGFFAMGTAVARMLGPLLLTSLIISGGSIGWLVLGGAFALAGMAMTPAVRWATASQAVSAPQPVPASA